MADLIDWDALLKDMGLTDAVKYGNKDAEQQYRSYSTWMSYEIADSIWDAPDVNRWIPVEDALPEIGYSVLVTRQTESNTRYIRIASRQDDCWMDNTDKYGMPNPHQVVAWMPMPDAYEPPKEAEKDDEKEEKP